MLDWEPPPCTWPLDTSGCPGWPKQEADWTPQHILALELATDVLWRRTGKRYGHHLELMRPHGSELLFALELPGPVRAVLEVRIDGGVLRPEEYRVRPQPGNPDVGELIRWGGMAGPGWPGHAVSVLYLRGQAIPLAGQRALGALATEIYRRSTDGSSPRQSIAFEGATYDVFIPAQWREGGDTGLPEVDAFLRRAGVGPDSA